MEPGRVRLARHFPADPADFRGDISTGLESGAEGRQQNWPVWMFAVLTCVPFLAIAFLLYEGRLQWSGGMPPVDFALLRIPSFRRGVLVATLFFFTTSFHRLFGLYLQEGCGLAPLQVSLAIVRYGRACSSVH